MFRRGDVLRLKSGSPPLSVVRVEGDQVLARWWDGATWQEHLFHADMLIKTELTNVLTHLLSAATVNELSQDALLEIVRRHADQWGIVIGRLLKIEMDDEDVVLLTVEAIGD
jgi:uncharacterized protein YodC (DUF2158 family)